MVIKKIVLLKLGNFSSVAKKKRFELKTLRDEFCISMLHLKLQHQAW